ncbi:5'-methylthioadenosine/adenosylhomocysteine nucleosidase [Frisingicoccus sp.]|uniref:5'-methylthioadenosine/adenosylhomocysteine nucleosidase n=1 Tax=Frisingicoccus sp. TaxID=1918627 RepID=UPI002EC326AC|nr:5'-methylthioadenosine/adenosylhomocysteine nucleosidase [Frisingicoccus sp.]
MIKTIGIIGAMEEEVAALKEKMTIEEVRTTAGMEFCRGICEGQQVVVVRSGIGKVNAAVCTQILCDLFGVSAIINTGVAGSLRNEINIGDIVLSEDALQHDMDATGFGYEPGVIPRMETSVFKGDEELIALAEKVCREVNPDIQTFRGRVVSGDQFISDKAVKERIDRLFSGYCTEMEGAAIAQTAWLNQVPFLVIRAISDKADGSAEMDYSEFEMKAIEHTVRLVTGMLQNM